MSRGAYGRGARRGRSLPQRPRRLRGMLLACASGSAALLLVAPSAAFAEPVSTSPPMISGALEPGQTVSATTGTWTDSTSPIVSYAYQWLRCNVSVCTDIDYATANPYALPWSFVGYQAEVTVTATDAQGESGFATSGMTDVIISAGPTYAVGESVRGAGSLTGFEASPEATARTADANLACPSACGGLYPYLPGTEVELIATPAPGSAFLGWGGGACSGSAPTCSLTLSTSVEVTATFSGQAPTGPALPLGSQREAGGAQPPASGGPIMGGWERPGTSATGRGLPAHLLGIHYRRRHVQAVVRCEETRPCQLSLAVFAGISTSHPMIARRSFTIAARRSARISLALSRAGERILARRHRLVVTTRLTLSGAGHTSVVERGRFTLTASAP